MLVVLSAQLCGSLLNLDLCWHSRAHFWGPVMQILPLLIY